MSYLAKAQIKRLIKSYGADRVSDDAVNYLTDILEQNAGTISRKAIQISRYRGVKTVTAKDFQTALEMK